MMISIPEYITEELKNIRPNFEIRWNPHAFIHKKGKYDAEGNLVEPAYEPRFELWDTDPYGHTYMVMRIQHMDGSFRVPDQKLIHHLQKVNPEHYGGDVGEMLRVLQDEPEHLREIGTQKDSDDLIEAISQWGAWCALPKSGPALQYRGKRILS